MPISSIKRQTDELRRLIKRTLPEAYLRSPRNIDSMTTSLVKDIAFEVVSTIEKQHWLGNGNVPDKTPLVIHYTSVDAVVFMLEKV